jgi:hypothetical protein
VPTSGDVHLYSDPRTFTTDTPLLYADCEGLEGGERTPMAVKSKKRDASGNHSGGPFRRTGSFEKNQRKLHHTSDREIQWAINDEAKTSREFAVMNLYPRLLYTFSDVIVFVLRNPRLVSLVLL